MSTRRRYTLDGRLGRLIVRGRTLRADIAEATTKAALDLSASQVTQLDLTISDPDLKLLAAGLFEPSTPTKGGSQVDYGTLLLEVAAVEVSDQGRGAELQVTARSLGAGKLKRARGALVRRNLSPTAFVALEAKAAGLRFIGEPSATRTTITRQGGDQAESSWDTINRLAKELGFIAFESGGALYFGRPTYLIGHTAAVRVAWPAKADDGVRALPRCRKAPGDGEVAASVDLELVGAAGDNVYPGMALDLSGVPGFTGRYLITGVGITLDDTSPVSVSATTPINPAPEPPEGATPAAPKVGTPKAGTYAGTPLDATQLGNATAIYRAALKAGAGERGALIGIMTALQESTLRNLKYGDRDSLGLFQQRTPWGTELERTTPTKAAALFYTGGHAAGTPGLLDVAGWRSLDPAVAAQKVQRSAYPTAYAKWRHVAEAIVRAIAATAVLGSSSTAKGTAAAFVSVALAQAGDRYVYGAEAKATDPNPDAFDCSELVEWAAARVGVKFPDGTDAQLKAVKRINVDQALRIRGALLFHPGHVAISLGDGRTIEAAGRKYGVRSMSAGNRFTAAGLIPSLRY